MQYLANIIAREKQNQSYFRHDLSSLSDEDLKKCYFQDLCEDFYNDPLHKAMIENHYDMSTIGKSLMAASLRDEIINRFCSL
jgi:hypothetical protein